MRIFQNRVLPALLAICLLLPALASCSSPVDPGESSGIGSSSGTLSTSGVGSAASTDTDPVLTPSADRTDESIPATVGSDPAGSLPATSEPEGTSETASESDTPTTPATPTPTSAEPPTATPEPPTTTTPATTTSNTPATTTSVTPTPTTTTKTPTTTKEPETEGPAVGASVTVRYLVNNNSGGSLSGSTYQTIRYGQTKTTSVTATAKLGYKFTGWSDGVKTATRSAESFASDTTLVANFEIDALELPVISLTTKTGYDVTSKETYIDGTISIANADGKYTFEDLDMEIRGRGNYSWNTPPKKSYKIKLSESKKLLGLGEGKNKTWCLIANYCDQSLLRNYLTYQLCRKLSGMAWAPDCTNVEVYLNGEYRGVYLLIENIKVDEHRVAVDENVETGTDIGYLLQMTNNSDEYYRFNANGYNFDIKNDLSSNSNTANRQRDYIADYVNQCWNAVKSGNQAQIERLIDINSVIDTYLVEEFVKNLDVGYDSFYLYKDKGGKLFFGPIWDFDLAFGNADDHECEYPEDIYVAVNCCSHYHSNEWYSYLMEQSWFRQKVAKRWQEKEVREAFGSISELAASTAKAGIKAFNRNFEKWNIFGQKTNRESWVILSLERNYTAHYEYLADWIGQRYSWLNAYIGGSDYNSGNFTGGGRGNWWQYTFSGGSGSARDPYRISTPGDFADFTNALNYTNYSGKYFKQTADLNMSAVSGYRGIGASGNFAGVYDGAGHTITANIRSSDGCIFPYVSGVVMNLITRGSVSNQNQAAGICRSVRLGGALINCGSYMDVTSYGGNAGGLSPSTETGDPAVIVNCFFAGTLNGAGQNSPINCWMSGRSGTFSYLYYSEKCDNGRLTLSADDTRVSDSQLKNQLAGWLNDNFAQIRGTLSAYGLSASDLCSWKNSSDGPVMVG